MSARAHREKLEDRPAPLHSNATDAEQAIAVFDENLRLAAWSDRFFDLLGYPRERARAGQSLADFVRHDAEKGTGGTGALAQLMARQVQQSQSASAQTLRWPGPNNSTLTIRSAPLATGVLVLVGTETEPSTDIDGAESNSRPPPSTSRAARAGGDAAGESDSNRFRDFLEASFGWFWETDEEHRLTFLSDQFVAGTGIPIEQMIGRTRVELGRAAGVPEAQLAAHMADLEQRRSFRDFHYILITPSGSRLHIKVGGRPLFDSDGRFLGYRGSATDVTSEVEALEAAERARQQLDDAIESFSEGFALFDAQDRLVFANICFHEIYAKIRDRIVPGIEFDELVRLKFESGLFAETGAKMEDRIRWYTDLHRDPHDSHEIQLSDGRWLRISDRRTADGGIVSVRTDITELKRRERALIELSDELSNQNLRFEAALNNMIQGLCMFDSEQRLIVCNDRYLDMYGFSPDVVKPGISLKEIMEYSVSLGNYRSEDAAQAIAERPWHAAKPEQATLYQRLTDGRIMAVMHQPMRGGGSVATYEDVTQTVRAEESLREYASRLERSNQELQDFASVASHDLQEPLRKIEAFSDRLMAKCGDELSENATMYVERMRNAASRMRLLINDLLTYSRVTSRARPFMPVDIGTIASEVVSDLQIAIEQSEGQVNFHDLPVIEGDATQIRQLLQNLIANALKFRAEGMSPVVSIDGRILEEPSELDGSPGSCELTIADNGIGFEQKHADRIFGIFQRLHGRNEYEGTGIGLATCRKIVERHGGSIKATGVPGKGATFTITLPVKQPHGEPVQ